MNVLQRFPFHPTTKEKDPMTRSSVVAAALLVFALGAGAAWAQDKPPAAGSPPAATSQPPATTAPAMSASEKAAIAKSCTDQANAKGLHGKARKKFRSACKKAGGKME
jgi:psiF repeat